MAFNFAWCWRKKTGNKMAPVFWVIGFKSSQSNKEWLQVITGSSRAR